MNHALPNRQAEGSTAFGVALGIGAGALWGLVFLAPELVPGFSALELTIGRYLAYGMVAALLIAPRWRKISSSIGRSEWLGLSWLSLAGNTVYYILLSAAVQYGGIALTSLVIGFLPVAVTIIGSRDQGAVPIRKLTLSVSLCVAGAVCIGWQAMVSPTTGSVLGLICAIGALVAWTIYGVSNSRWLGRVSVSAHDWGLLTGVATGAQSILLIPVALVLAKGGHDLGEWSRFVGVSLGLAVLASVAGGALWNQMSRLLPLTLVGQMILFETLFALVYGFLWEQRLPTILETAAFGFIVLSVVLCLSLHRKPGERQPNSHKLRARHECPQWVVTGHSSQA